jgi:hypothetical protein
MKGKKYYKLEDISEVRKYNDRSVESFFRARETATQKYGT